MSKDPPVLAASTDLEAGFARGAVAMTMDDFATALVHFAEIQRLDADYRAGLGRRTLLVVLDMLGPDDQRARRFRQRLFQH